ncbi:hypothetical protein ACFFX1_11205 [Dactylosporangium sucinum]|nr:hypothetical protein [Dactylosporangium sucinum]
MRAVRSQVAVNTRLADAATPGQRVVAAAQHLSSAMQDADAALVERIAETAVADLLAQAQELAQHRNRTSA